MGQVTNTTCDFCSKDITLGTTGNTRLVVAAEMIPLADGVDASTVLMGAVFPTVHLCDETCLAGWSAQFALARSTARADVAAAAKASVTVLAAPTKLAIEIQP